MYYYKMTIQYEGTKYAGFQWQKGILTIQSEFNTAASKIINGKFTTMAASRTDTGVHAIGQIIKITSTNPIDLSLFPETLNRILPPQVRCIAAEECAGLFRPAAESTSKEYRYFFTNQIQPSKKENLFIANISNKLDLDKMLICVRALVGEHDFCNFYSSGSNVKSTIRNIYFCELSIINPQDFFSDFELFEIPKDLSSCYQLRIEANGFLKQMIRHIVRALWMVGSGKISIEHFMDLLHGPKKAKQIWKVASPNGLFLYRINYPL